MTVDEVAEERYGVADKVRGLRESIPGEDWLALYSVLNYLDMNHGQLAGSLTSAKRTRTFVTSLLICLLSDTRLREEFVGSCGRMEVKADSDGKVEEITGPDGTRYVYGQPPAQVRLINEDI